VNETSFDHRAPQAVPEELTGQIILKIQWARQRYGPSAPLADRWVAQQAAKAACEWVAGALLVPPLCRSFYDPGDYVKREPDEPVHAWQARDLAARIRAIVWADPEPGGAE
jgi:hypothetical protein